MGVSFAYALMLAGILFLVGLFTVSSRRNLIMMLLGLEIMLNAVSLIFVAAALRWRQIEGQAISLFVLAVAAAEVSLGLAFIIAIHRRSGSVDPGQLGKLK